MTALEKRREKILEFVRNYFTYGVSDLDFSKVFYSSRLTEAALTRLQKDGLIRVDERGRYIAN
jgi:hypothetical protein